MQRLFGFGAILLIATGMVASSARADDRETCRVSSGDEALAACTRAIASGKYKGADLGDIYDDRGVERKAKDDIDGAISDYEQAIKLNPKSSFAFNNRGLARQAKGDTDGAMADFNQAIRLDPKYAHAYGNRGDAKKAKGDIDGAIADYDQSIQLDPKNINAYNNRGNAKKSKNDFDGAIADYDQAIRLDPKFAFAYDNRGDAKKAKGDLDGAMADYNQAIRIDPSYTSAYTDLGLVYELKNDIANARAEFNVALSVPPKYDSGKWAQDTAREHLAKLAAPPNQRTGPSVVTTPVVNPPVVNPPIVNPPVASAGRRVALVIGNSAYTVFPQLPNPRNDAEDLAKALKDLGFDVLLGTDLKRSDMEDIFIRFAKKARDSDTALVFYAGHGLQHQGINYLAPVDSRLDDEADLRKLTNLQDVIDDLQRAGHVRILIVDACRDNEVVKQLAARLPSTRSAAFTRGLAAISGADGTLIAFATQPNRVAADGAGRNSPFTQSLLKNLQTPGLELRTLMTRVRAEVVTATSGAQRPEVWDSLVGEFAFKTAP